jgi:hypothetical protein
VGLRGRFLEAGRVSVEEEGEDGAEGGGEEEEAEDGEEDAGRMANEPGDGGDAGAGVGEDEAEEREADPAGNVKAAAGGGDGEDDHDGEGGESEGDDEFVVERAGSECEKEGDGCGDHGFQPSLLELVGGIVAVERGVAYQARLLAGVEVCTGKSAWVT